jgi:hypothetical protein
MTEPIDEHLTADAQLGHDPVREGKRPERSVIAELAARKSPETNLDPIDADVHDTLPGDTALLVVASAHPGGLQMTFHHGEAHHSAPEGPATQLRKKLLTISEFARTVARQPDPGSSRNVPWRTAYFQLASMWEGNVELVRWIHGLLTSGASRPRLIVKDDSGSGIPWELFFQQPVHSGPNATSARGWLGALIPVARWTTLRDGGLANRMEAERKDHVAGLLLLETGDLGTLAARFDQFLVEPRTEDMRKLWEYLEKRSDPFGLVMIRCHGSQPGQNGNGELCEISYNEYAYRDFPALASNGALVFLNACFGAAPEGGPSGQPATFSELFLRKGASGVIAATAEIDADHSQDLAEELLVAASRGNWLNISGWLHDWRRDYAQEAEVAAASAPENADEPVFKRFFEAFKYIYFGHFDSTLRAVPNGLGGQVA